MTLKRVTQVAAIPLLTLLLAGCSPDEPAAPEAPVDAGIAEPAAPKVDLTATPTAATPPAPGAPPATPPATSAFPDATKEEGLPMTDDEGNELNSTLARLQYSVDSYYRVYDTQVADDDSPEALARLLPELKSLDQLVRLRYIRAVPEAPDGRKYVLDPGSRKVKIQ